jgi:hypothetical protein
MQKKIAIERVKIVTNVDKLEKSRKQRNKSPRKHYPRNTCRCSWLNFEGFAPPVVRHRGATHLSRKLHKTFGENQPERIANVVLRCAEDTPRHDSIRRPWQRRSDKSLNRHGRRGFEDVRARVRRDSRKSISTKKGTAPERLVATRFSPISR